MSENLTTTQGSKSPENFSAPRHWLGIEELSPAYWSDEKTKEKRAQEFYDKPIETLELIEKLDTKGVARRDFLTIMGASMALAGMACARRPVHKIIPYVVKPEEITTGVASYYATACPDTGAALLAKVREGRPVKLEGRPYLSARDQAHLLDLYDPARAQSSMKLKRGKKGTAAPLTLDEAHAEISAKLEPLKSGRGRVVVLGSKTQSPLIVDASRALASSFPSGAYYAWNGGFSDGVLRSDQKNSSVEWDYDFSKAEVVLSFGVDILGTHRKSARYLNQWSSTRKLEAAQHQSAKLSKWIVAEPILSLTGSNADQRYTVHPNQMVSFAAKIVKAVYEARGSAVPGEVSALLSKAPALDASVSDAAIKNIAKSLVEAAGKAAVLGGSPVTSQSDAEILSRLAGHLNQVLGNFDKTVFACAPLHEDSENLGNFEVQSLVRLMSQGQVDAVIIQGWNPSYELPKEFNFDKALAQVGLVIRVGDRLDETAVESDYLVAESHFLESWGEVADPASGKTWIQQPTISPLYATESFVDFVLAVIAKGSLKPRVNKLVGANAYEAIRNRSGTQSALDKDVAWEANLREGAYNQGVARRPASLGSVVSLGALAYKKTDSSQEYTFVSYEKSSIGDGKRANNPWLQEMPDPITTATWDNYALIGPESAQALKLATNDVITLSTQGAGGGVTLELPVLVLPGVAKGVIAAALGYGRREVGEVGNGVGKDIKNLYKVASNGDWDWSGFAVKPSKTGKRYQIAITQWHNATENRPIINDISIVDFKKDAKAAIHADPHLRLDTVPTMWPKHEYKGYRWGMSVDLTSCSGCGACVIACQAENNIPVVGRDNVRKSREMHWMRIDRYFSGNPNSPDVVFQPMMCQHCENAPCETVCPVLATVHDDEGLNSQVYNRCVGTRYCQNNCPYKVRRFNFFDHWKSYEGNMNLAWNPDVTVRSRGIMEKCTFCVQRIRDAKDKAKDQGRKVTDKEFKTACQQTCPTEAISFGNVNDANSEVAKKRAEAHGFRALEVLNTVPMVTYLTKVRNRDESALSHGHGEGHSESKKGEAHHG